ncbi:helicase-primase complex component [Porcine lymphotropic herpesvirus 2]|uniref:Helicase-primase complex component n=1 Tax=Suid gammaherpesvirus 4 TaxID=1960250 RepID=Q8B3V3_9GAMA|nr:helicase-primase complex component [Porcine lymphotropic herpesvirus 2]AAO12381.1 helicase-primase complex component [Porcine lymphotropic herpesvirus 2]
MHGMVKGIHLFNVYRANYGSYIIWSIGIIPLFTAGTGNDLYCFIVQKLSQRDLESIPEQHGDITRQHVECGSRFILWEYALRLRHPVLGPLCSQICQKMYDLKIENNILISALPLKSLQDATQEQFPAIRFGALICDTRLKRNSMNSSFTVEELDVFLKTKTDTYSFTTCCLEAVQKKAKLQHREILDFFEQCTYNVPIENTTIELYMPNTVAVDILAINSNSVWNRGLVIFFSELYKKIYGEYYGLKPRFDYIFPGFFKSGSQFSPYFSSFPFINLQYTRNITRIDKSCVVSSPLILLDVAMHYENTSLSNQLLTEFVFKIPKNLKNIGISWPLWNMEINSQLCNEANDRVIQICGPHYVIKITFTIKCLSHACVPYFMEILEEYSSGSTKKSLNNLYNHFVYFIMNWCHENSFMWAAFCRNQVCLISRDTLQETEVNQLRSKYGGNVSWEIVVDYYSSISSFRFH